MMKQVTYHEMTEHFAKQPRKKLKVVCENLKIITAIDSKVKSIIRSKEKLAWYYQLLCEEAKDDKQLKTKDFSNNSCTADQPNTSSDILPSTLKHPQMQNAILLIFQSVKSPSLPSQPPVSTSSIHHNDPPMVESPQPSPPTAQ
jgi:hypothetical protein